MESAHIDRFVIERLPPAELLPRFQFDLPELAYPPRVNAAEQLIDRPIREGLGERVAIYGAGRNWRYRDVSNAVDRIARVLAEDLGLEAGNRVLLRGTNSPMMAAIWLAVLKAGGVAVTTMPLLRVREIAGMVEKAHISLAFCEAGLMDEMLALEASQNSGFRVVAFSPENDSGDVELEFLMRNKLSGFKAVDTLATDPALIAFTSGTTGQPKATVHFHRDVLAIADCFPRSILGAGPDDIFLCSAPMGFTFGLGGHVVFPFRYGGASVLAPTGNPDQFLNLVERYRPSIIMTAPTAYRAMMKRASGTDLGFIRRCVSAGEHLPAPTFEAWEGATGHRIIDGIGATEMLHIFISEHDDAIRPGALGRQVPGYTATVLDDELRPVPTGEIGRLAVRGPTGCRYLDDDRQTQYVKDGWNFTGDACTQDADGYFWFQSRTDDMIVSSGYNISGREVEEAVLLHRSVQECAVVGVGDETRGTIVKAFVVLYADHAPAETLAREIQDFVKATIAPFKYPRAIEFVDALPRNQSGKVQRFVLRDREKNRHRDEAKS